VISNYQCEDEDAKKVGNKPQVLIIDHRFIGTESVGKDEISRLQGPEAICRTEQVLDLTLRVSMSEGLYFAGLAQ
jgi:hypothetical protein